MPDTLTLKLTVYQPAIIASPGDQVGFEYDLTLIVPELKAPAKDARARVASAKCDVVPVTGALSFPNPAAPVISRLTGLLFIFDDAPVIGFPLALMAEGQEAPLTFSMTMAFPASPVDVYSGAIKFGEWPGPLRNVTASFLSPA